MAEMHIRLCEEIDRIVHSPYPTQLKGLRDIICHKHCSETNIRRSIALKQCTLKRLVECVIDGLRQWPYVLDIISRLACDVTARDAIIRQDPVLFSDVVAQATKLDYVDSKYATVAVSLLSHPLPSEYALPSEVQTLFIRLLEHAGQNPSSARIRALYKVLKGTSSLLLGLLSSEVLSDFEKKLMGILRNSTVRQAHDPEDQSLTLYCLAIMKTVGMAAEEELVLVNSASSWNTQDLLSSTPPNNSAKWSSDAFLDFFINRGKAMKTLQLLVLKVMDTLRGTNSSHSSELLEILDLSNNLISAIPIDIRNSWCDNNTAAVQRLQQRVIMQETDTHLRFAAFEFLVQLCKADCLLPSVVEFGRNVLTQPKTTTEMFNTETLATIIEARCVADTIMDANTTSLMIGALVDHLTQANSTELVESLSNLKQIMQSLSLVAATHDKISHAIMAMVSGPSFCTNLGILQNSIQFPVPYIDAPHVCETMVKNARREVCYELSKVLIKFSLLHSNSQYTIPQNTADALLELHGISARGSTPCNHTKMLRGPGIATYTFVEETATPQNSRLDWRAELRSHLESKVLSEHIAVMKIFSNACEDLEARCENVEQPLRDERAKCVQLQSQYDELNAVYSMLEAQGMDMKFRLDGVETEKEEHLQQIHAIQQRSDEQLDKIAELEAAIMDSRKGAEKTLAEMRAEKEHADLKNATILAKKEEEIEMADEMLQNAKSDLEERNAQLDALKKVLDESQVRLVTLQQDKEQTVGTIRERDEKLHTLEQNCNDMRSTNADLYSQLTNTINKWNEARQRYEHELQQLRDQAEKSTEEVNSSHKQTMDRLASLHDEEVAKMQCKISELEQNIDRSAEEHSAEITRRDEAYGSLKQQIERLSRKCIQKDQQIAEANAMRSNLMAAMGLSGAQALQTQSHLALPQRSRQDSTETHSQPTPPTPASANGALEMKEQDSFFASSVSGSTPKRPRTRKSVKVYSPAKPRKSTGMRMSLAGRSSVQRQPLQSLSVNRSPRKSITRSQAKHMVMNDEFDYEEGSTFDQSGMLQDMPKVNLEGLLDAGSDMEI
ncbi:Hypothetical protein R9X50_00457800 [Acrodontium crateriforme]|uniref:Uncharacterized protein n=1 Tax=Acrodontium crateriforme TaxID=150365 RepID=A0AAQ3RA96_9PEZI|nr:Hypothetical protein R9X50_00457800 [Acrodontium crateriforme]